MTLGGKHGGAFRNDARPRAGGPPGSDPELLREQLLDQYGVTHAILCPLNYTPMLRQYGEFGLGLARAVNEWLTEDWLDLDRRLYGSVTIPQEDPALAASEIARASNDPRFVQVLLMVRTRDPLGHPKYWPIYEAAVAHELPIAIHVGAYPRMPNTGVGWPAYYLEHHIAWPYPYQAHVASLIHSGVFERFPKLQFVLEESGLAWMPPLMWRLDRSWEAMRSEVPHMSARPSDLIRSHFHFTTQPMEETEKPSHLLEMLDQLGMNERIMFASDYPHWDFDAPDLALPPNIKGELRERIRSSNAMSLYRLNI
jgi:predicted TIM-barrel fold metal-dependent hydrolase